MLPRPRQHKLELEVRLWVTGWNSSLGTIGIVGLGVNLQLVSRRRRRGLALRLAYGQPESRVIIESVNLNGQVESAFKFPGAKWNPGMIV